MSVGSGGAPGSVSKSRLGVEVSVGLGISVGVGIGVGVAVGVGVGVAVGVGVGVGVGGTGVGVGVRVGTGVGVRVERGVEIAIEAVGTPQTYEQAFYSRDLAGILVLVGVPNSEMKIELPMLEVFGRGEALKSSWYGDCLPTRDFPTIINLYLQQRLDLDRFVSETIPLEDVEGAFERMQRGEVLRSVVVF